MFKYINFLLLAILLLIFSCDEELKPVIEGCTIETTCNYNADATVNDDTCVFNQGCNKWCDGDEGEAQEFDCAGECGGGAKVDDCGVCDSDESNDCVQDCANDWGGSKEEDVCGVCGGPGIPFGECDCDGNVLGCDGKCGSGLVDDECGICDGPGAICSGQCPPEGDCDCDGNVADCAGECGGSAVEDECGTCDADGSSDCVQDCNGDWGGPDGVSDTGDEAAYDSCGVCDATYETQPAFPYGNCDCLGTPNGEAFIDGCVECAVEGDHPECPVDCADEEGGTNFVDNCGACVPAGDTSCVQGCDSNWCNTLNCPQLVVDNCGVCGGDGPEEYHDCDGNCTAGIDCANICGGSLVIDDCGICGGSNDCFGCNDWYMANFICDDTEETDKCCVEDDNNNDNRCKLNGFGNNCDFSLYCQREYVMECDLDGEYCDYDGAAIGDPCSTSAGSFTEGEGLCRKVCDVWTSECFNITCNNPLLDEYCDYDGAEVGTPCSTSETSFTEGEGFCVLDLSDDFNYSTGYITYYDTGCGDGTDSCCIEPECNEPFTLSLEYINESTLQVNYSSTEPIGGFQFDVDGATVTGGSGGSAADAGFAISTAGSTVLAFSFSGATMPAGSGTLTNLNIDTGVSTQLCLQNVIISDTGGEGSINTCPKYWQLTCIPIP